MICLILHQFNLYLLLICGTKIGGDCNLISRTTPKVSTKLHFVEISSVSERLWLFNHKRADFWLANFGFLFHFSASLR